MAASVRRGLRGSVRAGGDVSAALIDEHPPRPFEPECWLASCARPRVKDSVLCALHAPQSNTFLGGDRVARVTPTEGG